MYRKGELLRGRWGREKGTRKRTKKEMKRDERREKKNKGRKATECDV